MDEALRSALRDSDWSQRATALRRAGEEDRARRVVARAAREGQEGATEALEEFPLDEDARALLEVLRHARKDDPVATDSLNILLGDGDPRLTSAGLAWVDLEWIPVHLRAELTGYPERLSILLGEPCPAFERAVVDEAEGLRILQRLETEPSDPALPRPEASALSFLQLRFLSLRGESALFRDRVLAAMQKSEHADRVEAVVGEGRAGGVGPWRQAWVRPCLRDPQTLALSPNALRGWCLPPGSFEVPRGAQSLVLFALDDLRRTNDVEGFEPGNELLDAGVAAAQEAFGDHVVRWRGNRFLAPCVERDGAGAFREACERLRARLGSGFSGAITTELSGSWDEIVDALEFGLRRARAEGPGTLEEVEH